MSDLIDRDATIKAICERECDALKPCRAECESIWAVKEMPSVQPRKGLWIDIKYTFMTKCSVCDWINNDDSSYNFCPRCGADMRVDSDEKD